MVVGIPHSTRTATTSPSLLHQPDVGVLFLPPANKDRPPLRIFYPASILLPSANSPKQPRRRSKVGWFRDTGVLRFLTGYAHMILGRTLPVTGIIFRCLVQPMLGLVALFLPLTWMTIPGLYEYESSLVEHGTFENNDTPSMPLVVFSHGLTGTGQENIALCTAWARQGYIVVGVHHTDGSSCAVQQPDGYEHGPSFANYDASFRPRQVQHRSQELLQAYQFLTDPSSSTTVVTPDHQILHRLRRSVDKHRAVAAGFSYGAATVARTVVRSDHPFVAAILLDGWFHIDVQQSAGIEFRFPNEAFENIPTGSHSGLPVPSLFVNSEQFQGYDKLYGATKVLAGTQHTMTVLPGTAHNNFCDLIFWFPNSWLRRFGAIGTTADPIDAYHEIVAQTSTFLKQVTTK